MSEPSEKWNARQDRIARFTESIRIRPDRPGYAEAVRRVKQLELAAPQQKKAIEAASERAGLLATAYLMNGPELPVDHYLRHFLAEYNNRLLQGEGVHQPTSWNVLRAFTEPDERSLVLRLLPEKHYIIPIDTILEEITDPNFTVSWNDLQSLEELTIYEANMLGGKANFAVSGHPDLVLSGFACVREQDEISLMAVFGKPVAEAASDSLPVDRSAIQAGKQFLIDGKENIDVSDVGLLGDMSYRPIILLSRLQVSSGAVQVRYILEERKDIFRVSSDDPDVILQVLGREDYEVLRDQHLSGVKSYSDLFETVLHLPKFFVEIDKFDDETINERHPTQFKSKSMSGETRRLKKSLRPSEVPNYVDVLRLQSKAGGGEFVMPPTGLKLERHGYWKTLGSDEAGTDRNGRVVHGKTWVTKETSWVQGQTGNIELSHQPTAVSTPPKASEKEGYVYVLKNSMHPRDTYKIGFTTSTPDQRAAQLDRSSGQPDTFNVVQEWHVRNPRHIEQEVHQRLKSRRINNSREFFSAKYRDIRNCIELVIGEANAEIESREPQHS